MKGLETKVRRAVITTANVYEALTFFCRTVSLHFVSFPSLHLITIL